MKIPERSCLGVLRVLRRASGSTTQTTLTTAALERNLSIHSAIHPSSIHSFRIKNDSSEAFSLSRRISPEHEGKRGETKNAVHTENRQKRLNGNEDE